MQQQQTSSLPPAKQAGTGANPPAWHHLFELLFIAIEIVVILLFGFCFMYPQNVTIDPTNFNVPGATIYSANTFTFMYPFYQDIHVFVFIGLAFLLAYLTRFGWASIGIHFMVAIITVQVYILFRAFWLAVFTTNWDKVQFDFNFILTADFCVASCAVTWAAVAGRLGAAQMLSIACIQSFLYALNEVIAFYSIHAYDIGGSSTVWAFGGFFALGVALVNPSDPNKYETLKVNAPYSQYSNLFALFGTLFLWVFFPSFNAARVGLDLNYGLPFGNQSHRAVMNTILALTASCLTTYVFTTILNNGKVDIEHIFKATITGGIIMGGAADLSIEPYGALLAGIFAAVITLLFMRIFHHRFRDRDTSGVFHYIAWPGAWGGVLSAIWINGMKEDKLGFPEESMFWNGRGSIGQSGSQLAILGVSIAMGLVGGLFSGILVKPCSCIKPVEEYDDRDLWVQEKEDVPR